MNLCIVEADVQVLSSIEMSEWVGESMPVCMYVCMYVGREGGRGRTLLPGGSMTDWITELQVRPAALIFSQSMMG
jgi:hypothetical protein